MIMQRLQQYCMKRLNTTFDIDLYKYQRFLSQYYFFLELFLASLHLRYSLDEGLNFHSHIISSTPIHIDNILMEPTNSGQQFAIVGHAGDSGVIIMVDFRGLHERQCM